jgi:hypothetical protein
MKMKSIIKELTDNYKIYDHSDDEWVCSIFIMLDYHHYLEIPIRKVKKSYSMIHLIKKRRHVIDSIHDFLLDMGIRGLLKIMTEDY